MEKLYLFLLAIGIGCVVYAVFGSRNAGSGDVRWGELSSLPGYSPWLLGVALVCMILMMWIVLHVPPGVGAAVGGSMLLARLWQITWHAAAALFVGCLMVGCGIIL